MLLRLLPGMAWEALKPKAGPALLLPLGENGDEALWSAAVAACPEGPAGREPLVS